MNCPLIKYRVIVQYLVDNKQDSNLPDRVNYAEVFKDYKKAKKECLKVLRRANGHKIIRATIEPVLLEESLI